MKVYGRYPHRNQLLGRISTPEEEGFLQKNLSVSKFMRSVSLQPLPSSSEAESTPKGRPKAPKQDGSAIDV